MKIYKPAAILGLYLMSFNPVNSGIINRYDGDIVNEKFNANKRNYTFVVNVGEFNPTEGVGLKTINNNDTLTTQTNYTGIAMLKASPGDTVYMYPTEKSGQFKNLEMVLNDTTFNMINLEPKYSKANSLK